MNTIFKQAAELLTEARGGRSDAQRRAIFAKMRGGSSQSKAILSKLDSRGTSRTGSTMFAYKALGKKPVDFYSTRKDVKKELSTKGSNPRKWISSELRASRVAKQLPPNQKKVYKSLLNHFEGDHGDNGAVGRAMAALKPKVRSAALSDWSKMSSKEREHAISGDDNGSIKIKPIHKSFRKLSRAIDKEY